MACRLRTLPAMAKTRKRVTGVPAPYREEPSASQFAGDTTAPNGERDRIAERAYELYQQRGGEHGRDLDDWLEAECELARTRNQGSKRDTGARSVTERAAPTVNRHRG